MPQDRRDWIKSGQDVVERVRRRFEAERQPLMTTSDLAEWLGVSARTICLWAELNEIPAFKIGRQWRFREPEIRSWLQRRAGQASSGIGPFERS
jgi:excisionase family DNA binding protein